MARTTVPMDVRLVNDLKKFRDQAAVVVARLEALSQPGIVELCLEVSRHVFEQLRILGDSRGLIGQDPKVAPPDVIQAGPLREIFTSFRTRYATSVGRPTLDREFDRKVDSQLVLLPTSLKAGILALVREWDRKEGVGVQGLVQGTVEYVPALPEVLAALPSVAEASTPADHFPEGPLPWPIREEVIRRHRVCKEAGIVYDSDMELAHARHVGELPPFQEPEPTTTSNQELQHDVESTEE